MTRPNEREEAQNVYLDAPSSKSSELREELLRQVIEATLVSTSQGLSDRETGLAQGVRR